MNLQYMKIRQVGKRIVWHFLNQIHRQISERKQTELKNGLTISVKCRPPTFHWTKQNAFVCLLFRACEQNILGMREIVKIKLDE